MSHDPRPVDYRKTKVSALQQLAAGGDAAAARELERRGIDVAAAVDLTTLNYLGLRALVQGWKTGRMPDDRDRSRALAQRAQVELEIRYRVDMKIWDGQGTAPAPPPAPPWTAPSVPRCEDWQRPRGSKLYPSDEEIGRARLNDWAGVVYQERPASRGGTD